MKLFEENDIFRILSEAVSEGILIVNDKQQIVASNSVANHMFGYSGETLNGQFLKVLLPNSAQSMHGKYFDGFLERENEEIWAWGWTCKG